MQFAEILARLRLNPGYAKIAFALALIAAVVDLAASLTSITLMGPVVTLAGDMGVVGVAVISFALALGFGKIIDWCRWAYLEGISEPADAQHKQILAQARPDNAIAVVDQLDQMDASFGPVALSTLYDAAAGPVLLIALALISWQIALAATAGLLVIWLTQNWQAEVAKAQTDAWLATRQRAVADSDAYIRARRQRSRNVCTRRTAAQQGSTVLYIAALALGSILVAQHLLDPNKLFAVGLLVNRLSGLTMRLHGLKGELQAGVEAMGKLAAILQAKPQQQPIKPQPRIVPVVVPVVPAAAVQGAQ